MVKWHLQGATEHKWHLQGAIEHFMHNMGGHALLFDKFESLNELVG